MQTQAELPEAFEGIDGHHYRYVEPQTLLEQLAAPNLEVVAEYEFVYAAQDEDELMIDKFVMAQTGAGGGVDYEFLLMASDWVDLDRLADHDSFQAKVLEADAKRKGGILVNAAFAKRLLDSTFAQLAPSQTSLPPPPRLAQPDSLIHELELSSIDPQNITRKEARARIRSRIELLKAKHRESTNAAVKSVAAAAAFSPVETMFADMRAVDQAAQDKLHEHELAFQLQQSLLH